MALSPGTRFGSLVIGELIGAGGMGDVYQATDTQLKRDVAIKVLRDSLGNDPERLARFQREAELLAALNHPNIAHIYGLEHGDGGTLLVMELIDGPTLADRLAAGAIPAAESLEIANQIADALEAAHERGIVHRDLKPANIKLRPDGQVKVLDFGIAKVFDERSGTAGPKAATVLTPSSMTRAGFALGTAAYMSPEQARGKRVDQRTDLWAFGCILYEMLTGVPAFAGEDDTSTLARVLERDADLSTLPSSITPALRQVLQLCLVKDVRQRVADIRDVRLVLKGTFDVPTARARPASRWIAAVVIAAVIAAVLAGVVAWSLKPVPRSAADSGSAAASVRARLDIAEGQHLSGALPAENIPLGLQRPSRPSMAFSPDGTRLVYVAGDGKTTRLYLRRLDRAEATVIAGTDNATSPFFAPDGRSVGFFVAAEMKRVAIDGGDVRTITASPPELLVAYQSHAIWTKDDTLVVAARDGIYEVSATGGELKRLTTVASDEANHGYPNLLPKRRGLLYNVATRSSVDVPSHWLIAVQPLDGGERRVLIEGGSDPVYLPSGHIVFARNGALFAVPFDAESLELKGAPAVVIEDIMHAEGGANSNLNSGAAQFAVSDTGSLAYAAGGMYPDTTSTSLLWVDLKGEETPVDLPAARYLFPRLSPDGSRISYCVGGFGDMRIWVYDLKLGIPTTLTKSGQDFSPVWSPDGTRLAFGRGDLGGRLFTLRADGSGQPEPVGADLRASPLSWSRDNVLALLGSGKNGPMPGLWTLRMDGQSKPEPFVEGDGVLWATFSPDGKWIAYVSSETRRAEVYVRPYPERAPVYRISADGGIEPVWSPNGKQLFFREPGDDKQSMKMMVVDLTTTPAFARSRPKELFAGKYSATAPARGYDIAPDGERFVMVRAPADRASQPVTSVTLVLNWFSELNKIVPASR